MLHLVFGFGKGGGFGLFGAWPFPYLLIWLIGWLGCLDLTHLLPVVSRYCWLVGKLAEQEKICNGKTPSLLTRYYLLLRVCMRLKCRRRSICT